MSRPAAIMTDEQLEQLKKLSGVLTMEQVADFFGITGRTLRRRMHSDARIMSAYKTGKASAISRVANRLLKAAEDGNTTAMIFYLKTQAGWRETEAVPDVSEISKLSDTDLEKRREKVGLAS